MALDRSGALRMPEQRAEAAWVGQSQHASGVADDDVDMVVRARWRWHREMYAPGTRHAQVRDQRAMCEAPQQILATPLERENGVATERARERSWHRPAQATVAHQDTMHGMSLDMRCERAPGNFDFR